MFSLWLWLEESWHMAEAMAPWLLLGFLVSGLLHSFLPRGWIRRHLSQDGFRGVWKAAWMGAPLPLCSCGVIPVARWLRKEGASRSSTMSFLVATPETGVDSILATLALLGPLFAVVRPTIAIVSALLLGWLVSRLVFAHQDVEDARTECADGCVSSSGTPGVLRTTSGSLKQRFGASLRYGFQELLEDVAPWLTIGLLVGGAISAWVPADFLVEAGAWGVWGSYAAALLLGIPLYVCATGSIPIAAALMAKGVSPGAALVFLMVGPATNMATIAFVGGQFGKRVLALYLSVIAGVAVFMGNGLDLISGWWPQSFGTPAVDPASHWAWVHALLGLLLLALLIPVWFRRISRLFPRRARFQSASVSWEIPGVSCGNCARHVEKAARQVPGVESVQVNIPQKRAIFQGSFDVGILRQALTDAGYPPASAGLS
ncbi:MAG TPA: SO_0444 family Cu/Zn efflux transporter [Fibrobacteraceae bacterium]|nr:SO_0444 family Cu/Zn efflux transporter [Fibrobacteraceae bacterium]